MSIDRPRTPLPQLVGAVAAGTALVVLTAALFVTMHVLAGRIVPVADAQEHPSSASELRVPSHEIGPVPVLGRSGGAGTMEA